jgi:hypothetical protein
VTRTEAAPVRDVIAHRRSAFLARNPGTSVPKVCASGSVPTVVTRGLGVAVYKLADA